MYTKTTLSINRDGKEYISKPFDFEAMCLINDKHISSEKNGPLRLCADAVTYMFDGVSTDGAFGELSPGEMSRLCMEVWDMYVSALSEIKNK